MAFVYLIKTRDLEEYKIGFTKGDIKKRLKNLQTGCPSELVLVDCYESEYATKIESSLHYMLDPYRVNGEWFLLDSNFDFQKRCNMLNNNFVELENYKKGEWNL